MTSSSVTSSTSVVDWLRRQQKADLVNSLRDEYQRVQTKTFTKWINNFLLQCDPPVLVKDLFTEIRDGQLLLQLLEVLSRQSLKKEKGKGRVQHLENIRTALRVLEERQIKLVNINPTDIADGKPAIVLGLLWTVILYFQIEETTAIDPLVSDGEQRPKEGAKKALLRWAEDTVALRSEAPIQDFSTSWRDGIAFNALVHSLAPHAVDMDAVRKMDSNRQRLDHAFDAAEKNLNIPRLLDAEDMDVPKPDELSVMTYVAQFMKVSKDIKQLENDPQLAEQLRLSKQRADDEKKDAQLLSDWLAKAETVIPADNADLKPPNSEEFEQLKAEAAALASKYSRLVERSKDGMLLGLNNAEFDALKDKWEDAQRRVRDWDSKLSEDSKREAEKTLADAISRLDEWIPHAEQLARLDLRGEEPVDTKQSLEAALSQLSYADEDLTKAQEALASLSPHLNESAMKPKLAKLKALRESLAKLHEELPRKLDAVTAMQKADEKFAEILDPVARDLEDIGRLVSSADKDDPKALGDVLEELERAADRAKALEDELRKAEAEIDPICSALPTDAARAAAKASLSNRLGKMREELASQQETVEKKRNAAKVKLNQPRIREQRDKLMEELRKIEENLANGGDPVAAKQELDRILEELRKLDEEAREMEEMSEGPQKKDSEKLKADLDQQRAEAERLQKLAEEKAEDERRKRQRAESAVRKAADEARSLAAEIADIEAQLANLDDIYPVEERAKRAKSLRDRLEKARKAQQKLKDDLEEELKAAGFDPKDVPEMQSLQKQVDAIDNRINAAQQHADDSCEVLDGKLQKANGIANDAEAQLKDLTDEINAIRQQLPTDSNKTSEDVALLMKNLAAKLQKEKKNQARLKAKLEKDQADPDLSGDDLQRVKACEDQLDKLSGETDELLSQAESTHSSLAKRLEKAQELADDAAAELQKLANDVREIESQLSDLGNTGPVEEQVRLAKRLTDKLNKAKAAQKAAQNKLLEEMQKAGLAQADHAELQAAAKQIEDVSSKLDTLDAQANSTMCELSKAQEAQAKNAAKVDELVKSTTQCADSLASELRDLQTQLGNLDGVKPIEDRLKSANELAAKVKKVKAAQQEMKEKLKNEMQAANLSANEFPQLDACVKEIDGLGDDASALERDADAELAKLNAKLTQANKLADDSRKQLSQITDKVDSIEKQLRNLNSISSPEERAKQGKELKDRLDEARAAIKDLKDKVERETHQAELKPHDSLQLDSLAREVGKVDGHVSSLCIEAQEMAETCDGQIERAHELTDQYSSTLQQLKQELGGLDKQMQSVSNTKPCEDRIRALREVNRKVEKCEKKVRSLGKQIDEDLKAEGLSSDYPALAEVRETIKAIDSEAASLRNRGEEKVNSLNAQLKKANELASSADSTAQDVDEQVKDIERQLDEVDSLKSPDDRAKLVKKLAQQLGKAKDTLSNGSEKLEKGLKEASLTADDFSCLSGSKESLQALATHMDEVKLEIDRRLKKFDGTVERAQQLASDLAKLVEKQQSDVNELERLAQTLENTPSFAEKTQLASELGQKLVKPKETQQSLKDKMEKEMSTAGISAKQFPELDQLRKKLIHIEVQLDALQDKVNEQAQQAAERAAQTAQIKNDFTAKLSPLADEIEKITETLSKIDKLQSPDEKSRVAKESVTRLNAAKKLQHELKRKFDAELTLAEISPAECPELQSLSDKLNDAGHRIDSLREDATKKAVDTSCQSQRVKEIADTTTDALKPIESQVGDLEQQLRSLNSTKSPEERAKQAADLKAKLRKASEEVKKAKEEFEEAMKAAEVRPGDFDELRKVSGAVDKLESRAAACQDQADEKRAEAERQLDNVQAVVNKHAKLRENLDNDAKDLAKQISATAAIEPIPEKIDALKSLAMKLAAGKKRLGKVEESLEADLAAEGVKSADCCLANVQHEKAEQAKLGHLLDGLQDELTRKTNAANDQLISVRSEFDDRLADCRDRLKQLETRSSSIAAMSPVCDSQAVLASVGDVKSRLGELRRALDEVQADAKCCPAFRPADADSCQKDVGSMLNRLSELEKLAAARGDVTEALESWSSRSRDFGERVRAVEAKLEDPDLTESDLDGCLGDLAALRNDARRLDDDFRQLANAATKAGFPPIANSRSQIDVTCDSRVGSLESSAKARHNQLQQSSRKARDLEAEVSRRRQLAAQLHSKVGDLRLSEPLSKHSIEACCRDAARLDAEIAAEEAATRRLQNEAINSTLAEAQQTLKSKEQALASMLEALRQAEECVKPVEATIAEANSVLNIPVSGCTQAELQETVESLRKRENELAKQRASLDVAQVKLDSIAHTASAPFNLTSNELDRHQTALTEAVVKPVRDRFEKSLAAICEKRTNAEAQEALVQQLGVLHDEVMGWMKPMIQSLSAAVNSGGDQGEVQSQLARYNDDLPIYESQLDSFKQKRAELDSLRSRASSNARMQQEEAENGLKTLSQLAQSAGKKLNALSQQVSRNRDKAAQLGAWMDAKRNWADDKYDQLATTGDPDEALLCDSLSETRRVQQEVERRRPEVDQLVSEASKLANSPASSGSGNDALSLLIDAQDLKSRTDGTLKKLDETQQLAADLVKKTLEKEADTQHGCIGKQLEALQTCDAVGPHDNPEAVDSKRREAREVAKGLQQAEEAVKKVRGKADRCKRVVPDPRGAEIEKIVQPLESQLRNAKDAVASTLRNLDKAAEIAEKTKAEEERQRQQTEAEELKRLEEESVKRRQAPALRAAHASSRNHDDELMRSRSDTSTQTICEASTQTEQRSTSSTQTKASVEMSTSPTSFELNGKAHASPSSDASSRGSLNGSDDGPRVLGTVPRLLLDESTSPIGSPRERDFLDGAGVPLKAAYSGLPANGPANVNRSPLPTSTSTNGSGIGIGHINDNGGGGVSSANGTGTATTPSGVNHGNGIVTATTPSGVSSSYGNGAYTTPSGIGSGYGNGASTTPSGIGSGYGNGAGTTPIGYGNGTTPSGYGNGASTTPSGIVSGYGTGIGTATTPGISGGYGNGASTTPSGIGSGYGNGTTPSGFGNGAGTTPSGIGSGYGTSIGTATTPGISGGYGNGASTTPSGIGSGYGNGIGNGGTSSRSGTGIGNGNHYSSLSGPLSGIDTPNLSPSPALYKASPRLGHILGLPNSSRSEMPLGSARNSDLNLPGIGTGGSGTAGLLRPATSGLSTIDKPLSGTTTATKERPVPHFRLPRNTPPRASDTRPVPKLELSKSLQSGLDAPASDRPPATFNPITGSIIPRSRQFTRPGAGAGTGTGGRFTDRIPRDPISRLPRDDSTKRLRVPSADKNYSNLLPFTTATDRELMAYEPGAWLKDPKYKRSPSNLAVNNDDVPSLKGSCCQLDRCGHRNGNGLDDSHPLSYSGHDSDRSWDQSDDSSYGLSHSERGADKCSRSLALSKIADSLHDLRGELGTGTYSVTSPRTARL